MKRNMAFIFNLFIGIVSFGAWIFMAVLSMEGDTLSSNGFSSLKYFTVLSNLFNGAVCLIYAYWLLRKSRITANRRLLKLMATAAVGLTFLTVMVFLGPLYGYGSMFLGANFWMHLTLPVMSFISFIFLENCQESGGSDSQNRDVQSGNFKEGNVRASDIPLKKTLITALPTFIYEIGYLGNIAINGIGEWPNRNDFYGFLLWGWGVGAVVVVVMLLVTWGIALVLRKAER